MTYLRATAVVFAALAAACGAAQKAEPLEEGVYRYNDSVRWQRLSQAAQYLPPAERSAFFDERADLEDELRITMYDVRRVEMGPHDQRAIVHVEYTWYLDTQGTVHTTTTEQTWRRHGKKWLILEERRERGEPMPGIPEPRPDPDEVPDRSLDGPAQGGKSARPGAAPAASKY